MVERGYYFYYIYETSFKFVLHLFFCTLLNLNKFMEKTLDGRHYRKRDPYTVNNKDVNIKKSKVIKILIKYIMCTKC